MAWTSNGFLDNFTQVLLLALSGTACDVLNDLQNLNTVHIGFPFTFRLIKNPGRLGFVRRNSASDAEVTPCTI